MNRTLSLLLLCVLIPGCVLAGCGGSDKHKGPLTGLSISQAKKRNAADGQEAYAHCQATLSNSATTDSERPLVQRECADIQSGNQRDLQKVQSELCQTEMQTATDPQQEAAIQAGCPGAAATTTVTTPTTTVTTTATTTTTTGPMTTTTTTTTP